MLLDSKIESVLCYAAQALHSTKFKTTDFSPNKYLVMPLPNCINSIILSSINAAEYDAIYAVWQGHHKIFIGGEIGRFKLSAMQRLRCIA